MEKIKAIIVEDEELGRSLIKNFLMEYPEIELVDECEDGFKGAVAINDKRPDLVFLDIQMPKLNGFEMLELLNYEPEIIFTTAFNEYAIKAFELNSVDYLLKPIKKDDLKAALQKYQSLRSAFNVDFQSLIQDIKSEAAYKERFLIQSGMRIKKVDVKDIAYFYSMEKSTFLKTFSGEDSPLEKSLSALEQLLDPHRFFRINRKYIINMDAIESMLAYSRNRVKLVLKPDSTSGSDTMVSVERAAAFKSWLDS